MDNVAQTISQVTTPFRQAHPVPDRNSSRRSIQNSMNDLSLRVLKRLEFPDRSARLVLSIQAAIGHSNPGEVCHRSRVAIAQGLKLKGDINLKEDRERQKDRVSKLLGMLKTQQSKSGKLVIECFPGHPGETPSFIDHLGHLVEAADTRRRSDPRWKGKAKEGRWAATDEAVEWIYEQLPAAEPEETVRASLPLTLHGYIERSLREIKRAAERSAETIEDEYRSPMIATDFLRQLSREFWKTADSLAKTAPARHPRNKEGTYSSGLRVLPLSESQPDSEAFEEGGGVPQIGDTLTANSNDCNLNLEEVAEPEYDEEKVRAAFFEAVETLSKEPDLPTSNLECALEYARQGRRVLPCCWVNKDRVCQRHGVDCRAPGKRPLQTEWEKKATTDEQTIRGLWTKWPDANIGWLMGDGFLTLDFDGLPGQEQYQKMKADGLIPPTLEATTGSRGIHVVFATPHIFTSTPGLLTGLDIRSDRTQIVVAPSVSNKGAYTWNPGPQEPAPLPPELFTWLQDRFNDRAQEEILKRAAQSNPTPKNGYIAGSCSLPAVIPEGQRNVRLFKYGCGFRESGADYPELVEILERANQRCSTPLASSEICDIASNIVRRYQPTA